MPSAPKREDRISGDRKKDQREHFQRDRDRVLYAAAFRRLAEVTQVVSPGEAGVFHNRLTHTRLCNATRFFGSGADDAEGEPAQIRDRLTMRGKAPRSGSSGP